MANGERDFGANAQSGVEQQIHGAVDRAFDGVFNRHHAKCRTVRLDCMENIVDAHAVHTDNCVAELFEHRLFGVRARRAEEGDFNRLFHRAAHAHDLAPEGLQLRRGQRSWIALGDFLQHDGFALWAIDRLIVFLLNLTDLLREFSALVQQGQ